MSEPHKTRVIERAGPWGFISLIAYIGSFWGVILGLLQAIVWPAYVVYHSLVLLHA
jgi:hypothetical protein